jgi:hypothetical protein
LWFPTEAPGESGTRPSLVFELVEEDDGTRRGAELGSAVGAQWVRKLSPLARSLGIVAVGGQPCSSLVVLGLCARDFVAVVRTTVGFRVSVLGSAAKSERCRRVVFVCTVCVGCV